MLSKKVFLPGEPNFSAPPVHVARADVRDHVEPQEGDHRASHASGRGLQKRAAGKHGLSRDFGSCSIFDFFDSIGQAETVQHVSGDGSFLRVRTFRPSCTGRELH
jgi:hypothetical protein